jgi:hypothetical protein
VNELASYAMPQWNVSYPMSLKQFLLCYASDAMPPMQCLLSNVSHAMICADMLQKGFEWALRRGKPVNKGSLRYRWAPE